MKSKESKKKKRSLACSWNPKWKGAGVIKEKQIKKSANRAKRERKKRKGKDKMRLHKWTDFTTPMTTTWARSLLFPLSAYFTHAYQQTTFRSHTGSGNVVPRPTFLILSSFVCNNGRCWYSLCWPWAVLFQLHFTCTASLFFRSRYVHADCHSAAVDISSR